MEHLIIEGGNKLSGEISIKPAKNSVLPIIACCILSKEEILIKKAPKISDIHAMIKIINNIGGDAKFQGEDLYINCKDANPTLVEANLTGGIRSSIFILGPVLSRFKYAQISYPGGCDIGLRPIDLHIMGLKTLNVKIKEQNGMIVCDGSNIKGAVVNLDFPSVGATENIMMAAVFADGRTIIRNAAREPEIIDLQNFINYLGGCVKGAGTDTIVINGVKNLGGGEYTPASDRIVAGTYLCGAAITGGEIKLNDVQPSSFYSVIEKLSRVGCVVHEEKNSVIIKSTGILKAVHKIETQPFPGFPTDMQAQVTAMLATANGTSMVVENLFENRFKYTMQLAKMGADITVKDRVAIVKGVKQLKGADVKSEDLRGGAALVIAGLGAKGITRVSDIHHIDRGYHRIEEDLNKLGASIKRISGEIK